MGKIFRRTLTALLIVIFALSAAIVGATIQTFDGKGEWHTSDDENASKAMARAEQRAKIDAQKKAGVYLQTFSRSINSELAEDAISAITNNILEVVGDVHYDKKLIPLSESQTTILYTATLKAKIDTDGIYDWIKRDDKEKSTIISQTREANKASDENDKKIKDLREKYNRATSQAERDSIIKRMNDADRDFLANQKLEEANRLAYQAKFNESIILYTEAIELNPNYAEAYNQRGNIYNIVYLHKNVPLVIAGVKLSTSKLLTSAINDLNKAIEINSYYGEAYSNRGFTYYLLGNYDKALADFDCALKLNSGDYQNYIYLALYYWQKAKDETKALYLYNKAIELAPTSAHAYSCRASFYEHYGLEDYAKAAEDYTKAIRFETRGTDTLILDYQSRASCYKFLEIYDKAIDDYTKCIKLAEHSEQMKGMLSFYYQQRGGCYEALGKNSRAKADFAKAKELGYEG